MHLDAYEFQGKIAVLENIDHSNYLEPSKFRHLLNSTSNHFVVYANTSEVALFEKNTLLRKLLKISKDQGFIHGFFEVPAAQLLCGITGDC